MYRNQHKWIQLALLLIDAIISFLSLLLAGIVRFKSFHIFSTTTDLFVLSNILLISILGSFFLSKIYRNFFKRGYFIELIHVISYNFLVVLIVSFLIFALKNSIALSRLTLLYFLLINFILIYSAHIAIKKVSILHVKGKMGWKMLIVSDSKNITNTCKNLLNSILKDRVLGVILIDDASVDTDLLYGIPLINLDNEIIEYITQNAIDEVLLTVSEDQYITDEVQNLRKEIAKTGIVFSIKLWPIIEDEQYAVRLVSFGDDYILSFANRTYDYIQILLKRTIDILGGIIGSIITLFLGIFIIPAILIESPGPAFFKQKRVGRNGRVFTILKFRSMYQDAEERKAALMDKNKMKGLLFKVDDDPRITKVGKFIRKTSLDEFPQFFNVLLGDMSLVGTRPPTLDEYRHYNPIYKRRLSFRPGITGIWQTSGRNDITDFDSILQMDLGYIKNWSNILDIKLLLKTFFVVLMRKGAK